MTFYLTFGQKYRSEPHPTLRNASPDGWYVIDAPDEETAHELALAVVGKYWAFLYAEGEFCRELYAKGKLGEITQQAAAKAITPAQLDELIANAGEPLPEDMAALEKLGNPFTPMDSKMDKQYLRDIAGDIKAKLPDNFGFILLTFPFNGEGDNRLAYISNAQRESAINAMKEWLLKAGAAEDWMKHIK